MNNNINTSCIMVIFGGTGDLTHRKLMPALNNLYYSGMLPQNFAVVSVGRREKTVEEYRNEVYESVNKYSQIKLEPDTWSRFADKIFYQQLDFSNTNGYQTLKEFLEKLDQRFNTNGNRIFYLAVAPEYFEPIVEKLNLNRMVINEESWQRVMIEKPFGRDLRSAEYLNTKITSVFSEKNIYRIDHYLGKEMLQNISAIRFANILFEPVWNSRYIDNIQISSMETVGVETRGGYYEKAGALRDMVQNHIVQLLTLTTMEPPVGLDAEAVRDEKVKVLRSLEFLTPELIKSNVVRGQYGEGQINGNSIKAYRQEEKVSPQSETETYFAMKINIENFRWAGTPIYIRTGKRMPNKYTEIIIQFKQLPGILYFKEHGKLEPNLLVIRIQPSEGVSLRFNAKRPGTVSTIIPVQMDFSQNFQIGNNSPEAYERLLYDAFRGDSTLFTRWDEVEYSWKFVDRIMEAWGRESPHFPNYNSGTWGPREADQLLARDGKIWWNL